MIGDNRPKLLKVCRLYVWNRADQDDLYQEMLLQIWRALPNLREQAHANTWLYRIALNTAISFVRKHTSHRTQISSGTSENIHEVAETNPGRDPHTEEKLSQLFQAISQLNATEKAVITLFLEDLPYAQIAEVTGLSESNVGVMLHRAKKKLSTLMKEAPCTMTP
jgi:RNA polymerase sigma-70 factor, ECF subfamily